MIAATRSVGTWVVVIAFMVELACAIPFSIYVVLDALKDYRAVRALKRPGKDALAITDMFVKTETARLVKMFSWVFIILLSFTQPVPEHVQDSWYVLLTRSMFLVIGAAMAYNSFKEFRTRRELILLKGGKV